MSGERLYNRICKIQIADLAVENLKVEFQVSRTLKPEPNKCEVHIYNLSSTSRLRLESLGERPDDVDLKQAINVPVGFPFVNIQAGYEETGLSSIYLGEVRTVQSSTRGEDVVTELSSGDGAKDISNRTIHVPIGPGMPPAAVLATIVKEFGIGPGNLGQALAQLSADAPATLKFPNGGVLSGPAADELDALCRSARFDWSIQNGQLLLLPKGKALAGSAFLLNSNTGLVESPTVDNKGIVSAKTLMLPELYPGRAVAFAAKHVKGFYRVEECNYQGDTFGDAWWIDIKCKKLKLA